MQIEHISKDCSNFESKIQALLVLSPKTAFSGTRHSTHPQKPSCTFQWPWFAKTLISLATWLRLAQAGCDHDARPEEQEWWFRYFWTSHVDAVKIFPLKQSNFLPFIQAKCNPGDVLHMVHKGLFWVSNRDAIICRSYVASGQMSFAQFA